MAEGDGMSLSSWTVTHAELLCVSEMCFVFAAGAVQDAAGLALASFSE